MVEFFVKTNKKTFKYRYKIKFDNFFIEMK